MENSDKSSVLETLEESQTRPPPLDNSLIPSISIIQAQEKHKVQPDNIPNKLSPPSNDSENPPFTLRNEHETDIDPSMYHKRPIRASAEDIAAFKVGLTAIFDASENPEELIKLLEAYKPISKDMGSVLANKSQFWKIRRFKNAVYYGELHNAQRHGKGIMMYHNMSVYEGDWENNIKHGKGMELTSQGTTYEGDYKNGKPDGRGIYVWTNGEIYEGEWKHGNKHGNGVWKGKKGESYVGNWVMGRQEGYGVFTWRNGEKYEGEFLNFLKHGHGKEKFSNGEYYIGNYINGRPSGYGEYYWPDGRQYKGEFKNGLRHGKGVWKSGPGENDSYNGEWANDKKCGYGVFTWRNGDCYKGNYFDDNREGQGEMAWGDGSEYKGMWGRGTMHGQGTLTGEGQETLSGMFENGVFMGNLGTMETEEDKKALGTETALPTLETYASSFKKTGFDRAPALPKLHDSSFKSDIGHGGHNLSMDGKRGKSDVSRYNNNKPHEKSFKSDAPVGNESFLLKKRDVSAPKPVTQLPSIRSIKRPNNHVRTRSQNEDYGEKSGEPSVREYSSIRGNTGELCPRCFGQETVSKMTDRSYQSNITGRNMSFLNGDSRQNSTRGRERVYCRKCGVQVGSKGLSPLKVDEMYLTKKELARWDIAKSKHALEQKKLENLKDPFVCTRIKNLLKHNVWYPTEKVKVQKGRGEFANQLNLFCTRTKI